MPPRTEIQGRIDEILASILPAYEPSGKAPDSLAEQGLDSVGMVELLAALEDRFATTIPPGQVTPENFRSRDALVDMMAGLLDRDDS